MSGYSGRRAPNFSQYLNELNAAPGFYDQQSAAPQPNDHDLFDGEAELAMFTNAEFLDFDAMGGDLSSPPVGADFQETKPAKQEQDVNYLDMLNGEWEQTLPTTYIPSSLSCASVQAYSALGSACLLAMHRVVQCSAVPCCLQLS